MMRPFWGCQWTHLTSAPCPRKAEESRGRMAEAGGGLFTSQDLFLVIAEEIPNAQSAVVRTGDKFVIRGAEAK